MSNENELTDEEKIEHELIQHSDKLIKFLNDNYNPHTKIIITPNQVEIVQGILGFKNDTHIKK